MEILYIIKKKLQYIELYFYKNKEENPVNKGNFNNKNIKINGKKWLNSKKIVKKSTCFTGALS